MASKPPNPYIIDQPVGSDSSFFGREELFTEIIESLRYPPHTSVILYGQRRIGKTSLLLALEHRLSKPPFFPVYFDLSGKGLVPVNQVLQQMASVAAKKAEMLPPDNFDTPSVFHTKFLPSLYQAIGSERQPIFLLDEFEPIETPEEKLPEQAAARALDEYVYNLLTSQTYTDFIFAAGRRMPELTKVTQSSFKADLTRFVSVLGREQATALIRQDGVKGIPNYEDEAVQKILGLTRGHPYLTQLICHHLYDKAYDRSKRKPKVTAADVDAIVPEIINNQDTAVPLIWQSIPPLEHLMLATIAGQITDEKDMLNEAAISAALTGAGISPYTGGLSSTPENLVNWQMLEQTGNSYNFHIDFMRLWVAKNHSLEEVKEKELGLLNPRAEALYLAAVSDHEAGRDNEAIDKLYQAIEINPNHLPARMLLASILQKQGSTNEAIDQYEHAYKLDPAAVAGALAAVLFLLGAAYDKARNFFDAGNVYKRILEILPQSKEAKERLTASEKALAEQEEETAAARIIKEKEPRRAEKKKRRWGWAIALLLILLLLLCLTGLWSFDPWGLWGTGGQTTAQQAAATQTAAAVQALAQQTAVDATATAQAADAAGTAAAESAANQATVDALAAEAAAATATAQAIATAQAGDSGTGSGSNTGSDTGTGTDQSQGTGDAGTVGTGTGGAGAGSGQTGDDQLSGQVLVSGSDSMQPLMEDLAEAYTKENPNVEIAIKNNTSAQGVEAVQNGEANMGAVARPLTPEETAQINDNGMQVAPVVENDPIAIIVHSLVPVDDLTLQQTREIFAGQIINWSELGGPDAPIVVVSSAEDSDTRTVFEQTVLGQSGVIAESGIDIEAFSDRAVRDSVANLPYAIGFTSQKYAIASPEIPEDSTDVWPVLDTSLLDVKVLTLGGVEPSAQNVAAGTYPAGRPLNIVTRESSDPVTQSWLDFINSPAGKQVIEDSGYTPAP